MNEENQEKWVAREYKSENGLPFFTRFRQDLPNEREIKKFKTLIVVSWLFDSADGTGLPTDADLDEMEEFENLIDEKLGEKGTSRLMTVFTGEGVREWQFYTDDEEFFMRKFNEALSGTPDLLLEIDAFEDENWDAYRDFTRIGID